MDKAGDIIGKVLNAADLIDYQEGAVVSRTIVDKDAGTITVFAFDKEEGLSEHTAPFDAVVYILDGTADVSVSGKGHKVSAGEIVIMPANKPHVLRAEERFKMMLVMIREK